MNFHLIKHDDMNNGNGLRVTLFVSGCDNQCDGCHNPETWDCNNGHEFTLKEQQEIFNQLMEEHISGLTLSGGDPLHINNKREISKLCADVKDVFPEKTIWLYTGRRFEDLLNSNDDILNNIDVMVDGRFEKELADVNYHWAGSTNQRVIDVVKSLRLAKVIELKLS